MSLELFSLCDPGYHSESVLRQWPYKYSVFGVPFYAVNFLSEMEHPWGGRPLLALQPLEFIPTRIVNAEKKCRLDNCMRWAC